MKTKKFIYQLGTLLTFLILSFLVHADYRSPLEESRDLVLEFDSVDDFKQQIKIVDEIHKNKELYSYIKATFSSLLTIDAEKAQHYELREKANGLSEPQLMFLLQRFPEWRVNLGEYLQRHQAHQQSSQELSAEEVEQKKIDFKKFRLDQRKFLRDQAKDSRVLAVLEQMRNPTLPFIVRVKGKEPALGLQSYVNHPYYVLSQSFVRPEQLNSYSKKMKGDNLKQVALDFIKKAKVSIQFNFFEFDLIDVATEIIRLNDEKGIAVSGGVDKKTTLLKASNARVTALFNAQSKVRDNFKFLEVDASGLNHQKIIVIDAGTPNAEVLFLSGNMTQSCIGPEGDLVGAPWSIHQGKSLPNANNAIAVRNEMVAAITENELNKILIKKYRGKKSFPVSGSYVFEGESENGQATWMKLTFSPNGGTGDVGRDTINTLIRSETQSVWSMQFAFSSPLVRDALFTKIKQRTIFLTDSIPDSLQEIPEVLFTGDPSFSLREWAAPLQLSGLKKNIQTKKFSLDEENTLFKDLTLSQRNLLNKEFEKLRVSTKLFGEFHFAGGLKSSVKLHHKFFSLPESEITTVGTSYNTSQNAEGNMEQILIVKNKEVSKKLNGAFLYLYKMSDKSIQTLAYQRNRFANEKEEEMSLIEDQIVNGLRNPEP